MAKALRLTAALQDRIADLQLAHESETDLTISLLRQSQIWEQYQACASATLARVRAECPSALPAIEPYIAKTSESLETLHQQTVQALGRLRDIQRQQDEGDEWKGDTADAGE